MSLHKTDEDNGISEKGDTEQGLHMFSVKNQIENNLGMRPHNPYHIITLLIILLPLESESGHRGYKQMDM